MHLKQGFGTLETDMTLNSNLDRFWNLESIDIKNEEMMGDDEKALENFEENVVEYSNGRYYVTLPWKENCSSIPENKGLAVGRLKSLVK
jgi:hypothetical protein